MSTAAPHDELDHLVRALSHDMSANFMLLEHSFGRLKRSLSHLPHAELHGHVSHVEACLQQSHRLLDDLVQLARTGRVEMEHDRVELAGVVDEVLFEQRELLAQRDVEVAVRQPLPVCWVNQRRLKQIVTNLVRNAVQHGCDPEHPRITITPVRQPSSRRGLSAQRMAAFGVHDNGPGIERRYHEEIFLPGRRLAESGPEGSGMGLAIVKKIVDYYGGAVYVDPRCRDGATLVVVLPAAIAVAPNAVPLQPSRDAQGRTWTLEVEGHTAGPLSLRERARVRGESQ